MPTGLLGTEAIPINPLLNPPPATHSFGYSNPRANIGNPNRILGNVLPGMLPLTAFGLFSQAGNLINNEPMSAQDVINAHLSEGDARAKGLIIPPEPTVTEEERRRSIMPPNIPAVDQGGYVETFPEEVYDTPVVIPDLKPDDQGWREEFPIEDPSSDSMILHTEGLLKDEKVTSGILDETAPPFYSKIKKTIEDAKMEKGSAEQWKGYINNAGVNQEELDWIGLKDYLADKKSVTKEDVLNFVTMNDLAVQVRDVVLGEAVGDNIQVKLRFPTYLEEGFLPEILEDAETLDDARVAIMNDEGLYNGFLDGMNPTTRAIYLDDELSEEATDNEIRNFLQENYEIGSYEAIVAKDTMFNRPSLITEGDYTDYKEMVFQLPVEGSEFTQGHYKKYPNTFAHARFNTREIDGKKTLFIEELQSDWIRKGRDEGFITGKERTYDIVNKEIDDLVSQRAYGGMSKEEYLPKYNALLEELNDVARLETGVTSEKVPDIPFKKNWQDIVLKRLIRYASENGFDAIAMTGGSIQADRYDLSNHIDSISIKKSERADGKIYLQAVTKDQGTVALDHHIYPDQLEEHIGKDLAKKIKNDLPDLDKMKNNTVEGLNYSGLDLKIGGEGLKSMYDKIFSKSLNKIGKKFDAKVELKNLDDFQDKGYTFETPEEAYDFVTGDEFLNDQFMDYLKIDLVAGRNRLKPNELDPVSLLENANQDEKNAYISEFFKSSTIEDLNEGQDLELKLKTKDNQSDMWFMNITPSMKKKAIEAGFPIAYNKPVSPLFQFA